MSREKQLPVATEQTGRFRLVQERVRLLTYNTHLYGGVLFGFNTFADADRARALAQQIREAEPQPDVVGLTEVWDRDLAEPLAQALADDFPHVAYGPFNEDNIEQVLRFAIALGLRVGEAVEEDAEAEDHDFPLLEGLGAGLLAALLAGGGFILLNELGLLNSIGSGLMLLSRWPFVGQPTFHTYEHETGYPEKLAQKGVLTAAVQHPRGRVLGLQLTHTQSEDRHHATRTGQFQELLVERDRLQAAHPGACLVVMGDLNVPAWLEQDTEGEYRRLVPLMEPLRDSFLTPDDGANLEERNTNDRQDNQLARFLEPPEPGETQLKKRYDYLFVSQERVRIRSCKVVRYSGSFSDVGSSAGRVLRYLLGRLGGRLIIPEEFLLPPDTTWPEISDHYGLWGEYLI